MSSQKDEFIEWQNKNDKCPVCGKPRETHETDHPGLLSKDGLCLVRV